MVETGSLPSPLTPKETRRNTVRRPHANASFTDRPLAVSVNGGAARTLSFPSTGWWTTWSVVGLTATLAELGTTGPAYVYDYFAGTGRLVAAGGSVTATVGDGTYWIVAPVGPSGIAFLGDAGKLVAHGDKRVENLSDDGSVHATVAFAAGEGR
jgi:hypothetical protein